MSALRKLALCYLVSASAFGLAAGLRAWPNAADRAARLFDEKIARPAADALARADHAFLDAPDSNARVVLALSAPPVPLPPAGPADGRTLAHADLPVIERPALIDGAAPDVQLTLDAPVLIAPDLPVMPAAPKSKKQAAPARSAPRTAEIPRGPQQALTPEQTRARFHLAAALTPEMLDNFGLFIFVSKSASGPLAQRMYVFRKEAGALNLVYDWAASTGREKPEVNARGGRSFTATPAGLYQFDPDRMYRKYHSTSWDQDMPHAMFFNWQREGIQTGLAIHAATGDDIARLGARASAGCVHLSPENARTLFDLVKSEYRGQVPRFSINADETMSSKGKFSHRADGSLRLAEGYRVLIDIEDYNGADGSDAVALF
jgi:lipoprotein-anchoring transpeptidase ErfK/SrfK